MNKALTRGLALSFGLGLIALFGATFIPGLNGVILALLLGILIRNSISLPQYFEEGFHSAARSSWKYPYCFWRLELIIIKFQILDL